MDASVNASRTKTIIITYQHAYLAGQIDLCARPARDDDPETKDLFGAVGPVSRGARPGVCQVCAEGCGMR